MNRERLIRLTTGSPWLRVWPAWVDAIFPLLILARLLPVGYLRAVLALPIVLMVPGSLTLGAVFGRHRSAEAPILVAYAALLGVIWLIFISLAMYVAGVKITAVHAFWSLFAASTVAAIIAQVRILVEPDPASTEPDPALDDAGPALDEPDPAHERAGQVPATAAGADAPDDDTSQPGAQQRRAIYYSVGAIAVGLSILAASVYTWDHIGHPAPAGYTAIAWTGVRNNGVVAIGRGGKDLTFKIIHRQPDTGAYSLEAGFVGQPPRVIAGPLPLRAGPDKTLAGRLHVPSLDTGCTYRLIVTLTAQQPHAAHAHARSWSINLNVYGLDQPRRGCG
jgi:hypothetical protein